GLALGRALEQREVLSRLRARARADDERAVVVGGASGAEAPEGAPPADGAAPSDDVEAVVVARARLDAADGDVDDAALVARRADLGRDARDQLAGSAVVVVEHREQEAPGPVVPGPDDGALVADVAARHPERERVRH